jgi:hypothetical protein
MTDLEAAAQLKCLEEWAKEKLQDVSQPPWAWYQYMKLVETARAILDAASSTQQTASLPRSARRSGSALRLVDSEGPQDSSQPHADIVHVRLPI